MCGQSVRYKPSLPADRESGFLNCPCPEPTGFHRDTIHRLDPPTDHITSVRVSRLSSVASISVSNRLISLVDAANWFFARSPTTRRNGGISPKTLRIIRIFVSGQTGHTPIAATTRSTFVLNVLCQSEVSSIRSLRPAVKHESLI